MVFYYFCRPDVPSYYTSLLKIMCMGCVIILKRGTIIEIWSYLSMVDHIMLNIVVNFMFYYNFN